VTVAWQRPSLHSPRHNASIEMLFGCYSTAQLTILTWQHQIIISFYFCEAFWGGKREFLFADSEIENTINVRPDRWRQIFSTPVWKNSSSLDSRRASIEKAITSKNNVTYAYDYLIYVLFLIQLSFFFN